MSWSTFKKLVVDAYVRESLRREGITDTSVSGAGFTLAEVSAKFELDPKEIRVVESKALRKLQHPSRSLCLNPFLEPEPVDHGGKRVNTTSYPRRARLRHNSTTTLLDW